MLLHKNYSDSKYLTKVHDHTLVDFLPQVSPKYLNEGNLQGGYFSMHEDSCQIKLYLETHINL